MPQNSHNCTFEPKDVVCNHVLEISYHSKLMKVVLRVSLGWANNKLSSCMLYTQDFNPKGAKIAV